jgi:SWI/SNF-related matrix-associated actin-dependent regulator of chromatin subfamily A-like protein 1
MKLLDSQIEDAAKIAAASDLPNFSKAGTGKTHTALEAVRLLGSPRVLVLCPKIALSMWAEEAATFLGAKPQVIRSSSTPVSVSADVVVTTYDIAAKLVGALSERFGGEKAVLVNDESHYVNNPPAKRTKAVFGSRCDLQDGLAQHFAQVWNLTGTPMTGYADDMFTQAAVLHPEVFAAYGVGTLAEFENHFTFKRKKQYHPQMQPVWKIAGNSNEAFLHRLIYKELGAIRRMEAPGLPEIRHRDLAVEIKLTKEVATALKGMTSAQIVAQLNDPKSVVAKVWHTVGLLKVAEVVPYAGECAKAGPILLGVWHRDVASMYDVGLSAMGLRVAQVNGDTGNDNEAIRGAFNNGEIDVLVGQMAAMGVSWNLQKASAHVIIAEEYPSPSVIEQFYKRVYRYGQKNPVQVDQITSSAPVDVALRAVRERKAKSNDKINDGA